jgi:hypothetical protein
LGEAEYIVKYWQEMGLVSSGGNGPIPLSSQEIISWCNGTGQELSSWEFQILREISKAYLVELREAEKPERLPPYGDPVNEFDRAVVAKKVSGAFKAFNLAKR